jgi:hypothetical protein
MMVFAISGWKKTKNVLWNFHALHVLGFVELLSTLNICVGVADNLSSLHLKSRFCKGIIHLILLLIQEARTEFN